MLSLRNLDLINGTDDLAELVPKWLTPLYWFLIVLLSVLAAVLTAGQDYVSSLGSTAKSTVCLIALDSITYFTLVLSFLLLLIAGTIAKPWHSISPAFVGPMSAFIMACVYAHSVKVHESRILTLWLRLSSMTIVNNMRLDPDALFAALDQAAAIPVAPDAQDEDEIVALVRADSFGGLAASARNKGSSRPFLQALKMWWQQGTAQKVPTIWFRRRVNNAFRWCYSVRNVNHAVTVQRLQLSGRRTLGDQTTSSEGSRSLTRMKVMTAFNHASRHVVHAKYGNVWMRASGQPGLDKSNDAWYFIGSEIVQSLKAAFGIDFISGPGRYENVAATWTWAEDVGFDFRRDSQTQPIAEELGKQNGQDPQQCAQTAADMALGTDVSDADEEVVRVAREANVVACIGLVIRAVVPQLEYDVDRLNEAAVQVVEGAGARLARDGRGHISVAAMAANEWPEHELAVMIVEWVSTACHRAGRPRAPPPLG